MKILKNLFGGRRQGKEFVDKWKANEAGRPGLERSVELSVGGAATGAAIGAVAGGLKAASDISKVPYATVTVEHYEPVLEDQSLGHTPADDYVSGSYAPAASTIESVDIRRTNPTYNDIGEVRVRAVSETFRGRGVAQPTTWTNENVVEEYLNPEQPYNYRTQANNERYVSHYQTVQRSRQVFDYTETYTTSEPYTVRTPYMDTESYQDCANSYNSDGSTSYDCDTNYRTVTRYTSETEYRNVTKTRDHYRTEHYTEDEPVYAHRTLGHWRKYTPNVESRVVGKVAIPDVQFDHGVDVAGYMLKGLLFGAAIGAVAGGVSAAMEEEYFPGVLPGYQPPEGTAPAEPQPSPTPTPTPTPTPKPSPPKKPKHCGGTARHTHDNGSMRHSHGGGDRWHYHGCPDGENGLDENAICFKPDQVPECYKDEEPTMDCAVNGSVCYVTKW